MKHLYNVLLFFGLLFFVIAEASGQVVFTRADWDGLIGRTENTTMYSASPGPNNDRINALLGLTGNGQTWDMTTLIYNASPNTSIEEFISPVAGLPGADNPKAQGANFAVRNTPTSGQFGSDFSISFFTVSNADVKAHGDYSSVQGVADENFFDQPYVLFPFPLQNGSTWQASFTWTETGPEPGSYSQVDDGVVNGEGTLVTPAGSVNVIRSEVTSTVSLDGAPNLLWTRVNLLSQNRNITASVSKMETIPPLFTFYSASYTTSVPSGGTTEPPANAPGNLSPADGASVSQPPELSWASSPDADAYWLQVGDNSSFTKQGNSTLLVDQQGIQATNYVVFGLTAGTTYYWQVRGQNTLGDGPWSNGLSFTTVGGVAVERIGGEMPTAFELYPSYPNPFNPETTITFDIPIESAVRLAIFDALGREVEVLVSDRLTPGRYEYSWDASDQPSGLFLYRLEAGAFSKTGRMVLVK